MRGRYACFNSILPHLEMLNSSIHGNEDNESPQLEDLLEKYQDSKKHLKESSQFNK